MTGTRPDPDALLKKVQEEEQREKRGRLKIFLGASAGVGKTYSMLCEAHELLERGVDLVGGLIETHGRKETLALMEGVPTMRLRPLEYKGVTLHEFDIDAALARKPQILILDEMAHTNVPGSRHPKRWQDIEELLSSGISVYTALNIQHIESLRDVVAQISGVQVRETVPDSMLLRADEIELVDIPPDDLRQRLKEGKVYVPEQIDKALDGFFNKGNLIALRELALRKTADHVDAEMQLYREGEGKGGIWAARERVLVCVAPNRLGEKVVRAAARIGGASHAELHALYVESDRQRNRSPAERHKADEALRLAEELGMETARRNGHDIVGEILQFARTRNVNLIVVGKPIKPRWREVLFGSVVDELVRRSGEISVQVMTSEEEPGPSARTPLKFPESSTREYLIAVSVVALVTAVMIPAERLMTKLPSENVAFVYLVGIALAASRLRLGATLLCSILSVLAYDFFFISPRGSLAVSDAGYLPTFGIMFAVALLISSLTHRLKIQAEEASARERQTAALYDVSRQMAKSMGRSEIAVVAARRIAEDFDIDVSVLLPNERNRLTPISRSRSHFENDHREGAVAQWTYDHGKPAGAGTDTLPAAAGLYLPLITGGSAVGVLALKPHYEGELIDPNQRTLLQTFANGLALAIERAILAKQTHEARLEAESEKVRNALLSSVSHDIRSPLTAIAGAASALMEQKGDNVALAETIFKESDRLNRHVRNLLDMTRLESGAVQPNLDWNSIEEMVGVALSRTESQLEGHKVLVDIPEDLPLIRVDDTLFVQAMVNLLENAAKHTPSGTKVVIRARKRDGTVTVDIEDNGPGVRDEARPNLFEKFQQHVPDMDGFGLGLAIVRAIMTIHGGQVSLEEPSGGGSRFRLTFPLGESPPTAPKG